MLLTNKERRGNMTYKKEIFIRQEMPSGQHGRIKIVKNRR